jgi:signal transduction histidine kinase
MLQVQVRRGDTLIGRAVTAVRRREGTSEGLLTAGVVLGLLATVEVVLWSNRSGGELSTAILLGVGATVPLAGVRSQPVPVAAAVTTASGFVLLTGGRPTAASVVALVAAFWQLGHRHKELVATLLILPLGACALYALSERDGSGRYLAVALAVAAAAAVAIARARRRQTELRARLASDQTIADALLEHAARGERARIARELHDVVAHHISMIAVQAETARLATPGMPAEGARRLLAIGDTARTALTEMRRLLGVLREDTGADTTTRQPQPGLHQLVELVDDARASSGVSTRLVVQGRVVSLDPGIELTAFRIVQEALTNARRHAPGAAVDVELTYDEDALHLRIRDNGPGPSDQVEANGASPGGHGLLGMGERVASVGGDLRTGSAPMGGFLVEARLPAARPVPMVAR